MPIASVATVDQRHRDDAGDGVQAGAHAVLADHQVGEVALVALGAADVDASRAAPAAGRRARRAAARAAAGRGRASVAEPGARWNSSGSSADRERRARQDAAARAAAARAAASDVDLAEPRSARRSRAVARRGGRAAPARGPGDPDPLGGRGRLASRAPVPARRSSRSRSSRVCRRLTTSSMLRRPSTTHRAAAAVHADLVDVGERRPAASGGCGRSRRRPTPPPARSAGSARRWRAVGGVQPRVVALRLDVGDLGAADEPGHAAALDRRSARPRPAPAAVAALDHPAYRLGQPLGAHRLEHVVDGVQLEGVDRVLARGRSRRRPAAGSGTGRSTWASSRPVEARASGCRGRPRRPRARCSIRSASVAESRGEHLADPVVAARAGRPARRARAARRRRPGPRRPRLVVGAVMRAPRARTSGTRTMTLVPAPGAVSTTRP